MDGRGALIDLERYQRSKRYKETCTKNIFEEVKVIIIKLGYPGGYENFVNKWKSIIVNLEEIYGGSGKINATEWLDKTPFKIENKDHKYTSFLTSLDIMEPTKYLDKCKSNISKIGTHLYRGIK